MAIAPFSPCAACPRHASCEDGAIPPGCTWTLSLPRWTQVVSCDYTRSPCRRLMLHHGTTDWRCSVPRRRCTASSRVSLAGWLSLSGLQARTGLLAPSSCFPVVSQAREGRVAVYSEALCFPTAVPPVVVERAAAVPNSTLSRVLPMLLQRQV
jgi:hypothetical protein